jgi:hypothetical protein
MDKEEATNSNHLAFNMPWSHSKRPQKRMTTTGQRHQKEDENE